MKAKHFILFSVLVFSSTKTQAQQNTVASGGDASGAGGNISYSLGQIDFSSSSGSGGNLSEGVQQPYVISITTGIDHPEVQLELLVYPNPTLGNIQLFIDQPDLAEMQVELTDLQGKIIQRTIILTNTTNIEMESLNAGVYFVKVLQNNREIKTFKVIKN